jgi:prepilin-type N-terminal cleavage/methylation domain-containing protein
LKERSSGFTLIELLVVMVIISILMAVAVPVFLGKKEKALVTKATNLVKIAQTTMETCGGDNIISGGAFAERQDDPNANPTTVLCSEAAIVNLEPSLAKAMGANPATDAGGITDGYTGLAGHLDIHVWRTDSYIINAWTEGNNPVSYMLIRTPEGVVRICGNGTTPAGYDHPIDLGDRSEDGGASRMCPTGRWG